MVSGEYILTLTTHYSQLFCGIACYFRTRWYAFDHIATQSYECVVAYCNAVDHVGTASDVTVPAYCRPSCYRYVTADQCIISYYSVMMDDGIRKDTYMVTDRCVARYDYSCHHQAIGAQLYVFADRCSWMHYGSEPVLTDTE